MVQRNHHLAPRSAQSREWSHAAGYFVNHVHRGAIAPQPQLAAAGVRHVRQLFRYDLTPLCARLHDPIKSIPVLDAESGRAKFVGAPRRYQMPIRVLAATVEQRREVNASLILDKQGIVRIEFHANGNC